MRVVNGPDSPAGTVYLALADIGRADIQLQVRLPDRGEALVQRLRMTYRVNAALDDPVAGHRTL